MGDDWTTEASSPAVARAAAAAACGNLEEKVPAPPVAELEF